MFAIAGSVPRIQWLISPHRWLYTFAIFIIQERANKRQELQEKIKLIDDKSDQLATVMEHAHTIKQFKEIYKYHKDNPNDKQFENEYSREIALYKVAATDLLETYKKLPDTKELLNELDSIQEKKKKRIP